MHRNVGHEDGPEADRDHRHEIVHAEECTAREAEADEKALDEENSDEEVGNVLHCANLLLLLHSSRNVGENGEKQME